MNTTEEYWVYVLRSVRSETYYVGMAKDVRIRLEEHNRGKSRYTRGHTPYVLIYKEYVGSVVEARKREKYYKTAAGKNYLRKQGVIED